MAKWIIICLFSSLIWNGCLSFRTFSYAEQAQEYETKGDFEAAIKAYSKHIQARQDSAIKGENPYFYCLLIGDDYLKLDKPVEAKAAYDTARANQVDPPFLVDRAKILAKYYAEKANFEEAIKILTDYRELDAIAIDYEIDSIHKQMLEFEDKEKTKP